MLIFIILVLVILVLAFYIMNIYNNLVRLKNNFLNAFSQIQVQLKRRYDLVPSLVEAAKGYMKHEANTLEKVINARNQASSTLQNAKANDENSMKSLSKAESSLTESLSKFNFLMEDYPDLKASENIKQLSEELTSTENKVAFARQAYNDTATEYNTYKQSFPQNLFVNIFNHSQNAALLEFDKEENIQKAPEVKF